MEECTRCCAACKNRLCVHKVPLFSSLSTEELAEVASLIRHRQYKKGETLFREREGPDALIIVNEGSVKAYKTTPDGREQILYVFAEGDFFGERSLFHAEASPYAAEALTPLKTCSFSKESFRGLLRTHPDIALKVIEELEERILRMESALQSMGVRSVDGRISALLLDFAAKYGANVPEGILLRLPLSREGMANYLGVARETVSRKLGQLETDGVIRSVSNKSMLLLNMEALKESAGFLS